jgi:RNA polymerase sigma-70 factor (ECF subfamily)
MDLSDQQLLSRIARGEEAALATFYDRHAARTLGLVQKLLGSRGDPEDVLQETFWQVWCRAGQFDPERSSPLAWLLMLARSRALDQVRRERVRSATALSPERTRGKDPASLLEQQETVQHVRDALARLPEEQRSAISLAFYSGLTHEQVAQRQAVPLGTVKTRIRLGMRRLRNLLCQQQEVSAS